MIQYNLPYGFEMMQDPDVVQEIMQNVARLMARNCELHTEIKHLRSDVERLRMMLYGNTHF